MDRKCNACGTLNRGEAKFCSSCGSPLPAIKRDTEKEKLHAQQVRKFWITTMAVLAGAALIAGLVMKQMGHIKKLEVAKAYTEKFISQDDRVFGTVTQSQFALEALAWNFTTQDIKKLYNYATDSKDPDFAASMLVSQPEFKAPIPHANFMSLGIYNNRLYAVKFEFGETEKFEAQQLKIPNKEEIMYGRFMGLYTIFNKLYGPPVYSKFEVKDLPLEEKIGRIKAMSFGDGKPSNVYIAWAMGTTKVELAFFGYEGKLHLTVRFLYMPVWDQVNQQGR